MENLTLAGNTLRCQVWQETVQADGLDRRWHNTFWIDSATGQYARANRCSARAYSLSP